MQKVKTEKSRVWPDKCEHCRQKNLPCSKPRRSERKLTREITEPLASLGSSKKAGDQDRVQLYANEARCLADIRTTDPQLDKRRIEENKGSLLKDSYLWIMENTDFVKWMEDDANGLLWIKGDPGKGKTMLLCGIIDELSREAELTAGTYVSYFFCQATDMRINDASSVLRSLIYQLVKQRPALYLHLQDKYELAGRRLFEDENAWVALSDILTSVWLDPAMRRTFVIIDALDECLEGLPKLLGFIAQTSSLSPRVKWIVSSRNWPEIEGGLKVAKHKAMLCLEMNADAIDSAVAAYIQHNVRRLCQQKDYNHEMATEIQDYLLANADGTFLWVSLVCQELSHPKTTKRNAMSKLHSFPRGLDPLYGRMMDQIRDSDDADLCKQILAVAATVRRPLTLLELLALLKRKDVDDLETLTEVISLCGSFLTTRNESVYFVHQSAKDFLLSKAYAEIFPDGLGEVHVEIYSRSLDILRPILKRDMYNLREPGFPINEVQAPEPDPLGSVRYSCLHWVNHLCDAISDKSRITANDLQDGSAVDTFLRGKFLYWLEGLSLLHGLSEGVIAIERLYGLLANTQCRIAALVRDGRRFIRSHRAIIEQAPLQAYVSALLFSPSGSIVRQLFQVEEPRWIKTKPAVEEDWNACLQTLEGHSGGVNSVAFTHDGRQLASGSHDNTIKLWDIASGQCVQTLTGHSGSVRSVAFTHDGRQLASGSDDSTIKLWDIVSGQCVQTLTGHSGSVYSVAFTHDSRQLASGSGDNTIKLWDIASGQCVQTLTGHSGLVNSVAFTHDGRQLASGSGDNTIKLWDIASGQCVQTLHTRTSTTDLAFDSIGDYLLTNHGRTRIQPSIAADRIDVTRDTTITRNIQELGAEQVIWSGYGIDRQKVWVTFNGRNMVWLPPDYRPLSHTWRGSALGCGCRTGRVFILSFQGEL